MFPLLRASSMIYSTTNSLVINHGRVLSMHECIVETSVQPLVHTELAADAQSSTDELEGSTISRPSKLACRHFLREDAEAKIDGKALMWSFVYTVYTR